MAGRKKSVGAVTRSQATAAALRSMVLKGELKPGERLRAQPLADQLGVSRTPVNDALAALFKDGLLEYGVHRGYSVKPVSLDQLLDAFDVRLTLEGLACKLVAERGLKPHTAEDLRRSGGEWLCSLTLEEIAARHPDVAEVAVIGASDVRWGERPVAFVVPRSGTAPTLAAINELVTAAAEDGIVSHHAVLERVIVTEQLPRTSVGKIGKRALRANLEQRLSRLPKSEAPGG